MQEPSSLPLRIQSAVPSDTDFIRRLSLRVFAIYGPYDQLLPRWFRMGFTWTVMARWDQRPAGFAMLGPTEPAGRSGSCAEILAIAVEPGQQKRGIGSSLLSALQENAAQLGISRLLLHTDADNIAAQRLFLRYGFSTLAVKRAFYSGGQDAFAMGAHICGARSP